MAYHLTKEHANDYRCGCCTYTWTTSKWCNTLEEALEEVPVEWPGRGEWGELKGAAVIDGSTGEEVASVMAHWPVGYNRGTEYQYTRWYGYTPDTDFFDVVFDRSGQRIDQTWEEVTATLKEEKKERDKAKAERELKEAQERLAKLQGGSNNDPVA